MVTTEWVLTEVADGLASTDGRGLFARFLKDLEADPRALIMPARDVLFQGGVALYNNRLDKQWSLTDYISFVVMSDHGLHDALTGDHHFEQAGFSVLLK